MIKIENVKVYDMEESFKASKYPMSVNTDMVNGEITPRIINLANTPKGEGHDQFLTGIRIAFDLTCSNKMWVEAERYRFLEFVSSQSTMHRISKFDLSEQYNEYVDERIIKIMNDLKESYNKTNNPDDYLRLLYSNPCGFKLTARLTTNYRCLKTIYSQRKTHRLPEWVEFTKWVKQLPYSELIIGREETNE